MHICNSINEWRQIRQNITEAQTIGFVPTMGNLHKAHASLCRTACAENALTVVSLFINPTQFERKDDYTYYPRTLEADCALLQEIGVDYCFIPQQEEIYNDNYRYQIDESEHHLSMEGRLRPGHFPGVLTVVMKLFNIIKPHNAYFGEKDYQQLQLIRDMVGAFFMDINIIACKTIREPSGLAYSSRNNRLTTAQRQIAIAFAQCFHQKKSCAQIIEELEQLALTVDYVEEKQNRRFAAVYIDDIRLIDNYPFA